jgi:hypothetical protein
MRDDCTTALSNQLNLPVKVTAIKRKTPVLKAGCGVYRTKWLPFIMFIQEECDILTSDVIIMGDCILQNYLKSRFGPCSLDSTIRRTCCPLGIRKKMKDYVRAKRRYQTPRHHILQELTLIFKAKGTSTSYLDKSRAQDRMGQLRTEKRIKTGQGKKVQLSLCLNN